MIAIVIPVYGQVHLTRTCLESLLAGSVEARTLVVVDNHSTDETPAYLESMRARFESQGWVYRVITNQENRGFGRASNQGISLAESLMVGAGEHYVAVLNNDTWLMPAWDRALRLAAERTGAALVGPYFDERPFDPRRTPARARRFVRWNAGRLRRFWVPMLMFFRKSALDQVGLFDERYFVTCEEIDLRVRFDRAGFEYFMTGDCFIWHASKGTRGKPGVIRKDYEQEGTRLFKEKWGKDPGEIYYPRHFTWPERLKRRWQRIRNGLGFM